MGKKITASNYNKDPYFKRIAAAVTKLLKEKGYAAPVDVFMEMGLLRKADYENWRFGKVPYLEKVIQCNLSKCGRILRILQKHADSARLKPSFTGYNKWGKGQKTRLRFSKTADKNVEQAYAHHFVSKKVVAAIRAKESRQKQSAPEIGKSEIPDGNQP
jgi:hypothetical protein